MVRFDLLIFGYRRITFDDACAADVTNLFIKHQVSSRVSVPRGAEISERHYQRLKGDLEKKGIEAGEPRGFLAYIHRMKGNALPITLALLMVFLNIFSCSVIFDVRVSGNDLISDYVILEAVEKAGLSTGGLWVNVDTSEVEASVLLALSDISWINVNRRGSVAYVEVVESKAEAPSLKDEGGCCNIVADRDCVIEEISVERGVAVVSPGDVVAKGDILISGIVQTEFGTEFVSASGCVKGQASATIVGKADKTEDVSVSVERHLAEMRLNIFKFSINIFKNYRNSDKECDIIEDNETLVVFSECRLPVVICRRYEYSEDIRTVEYTDSRMIEISHVRHSDALSSFLRTAELVKIKTNGSFTSSGYSTVSDIVYSADVGEEKMIAIDNLEE